MTLQVVTSWYQENKGMIPNAPTTIGFVSTPILLHASSNLLNFSTESTCRKIRKKLSNKYRNKFLGTRITVSLVSILCIAKQTQFGLTYLSLSISKSTFETFRESLWKQIMTRVQ